MGNCPEESISLAAKYGIQQSAMQGAETDEKNVAFTKEKPIRRV
jgi:hypothetical protein